MEKKELIKQTEERYPFLTGIKYGDNEYIGIVINHDNSILTFYDLEKIPNQELKKLFLELGDTWWWESNRQIPIDIFLFQEMRNFRRCLRTFNNKDVEIQFGPVTSIQKIVKKRIKRRTIQLVKKDR